MKKNALLFLSIIFYSSIVFGQSDDDGSKASLSMQENSLDRALKAIDLTYKVPKQYTASADMVHLGFPPENPEELLRTANNVIHSQWTHENNECILFIKCAGVLTKPINKSIEGINDSAYRRIKRVLNIGKPFSHVTEEELEELNKTITYWPQKKAQKKFNAHHVLTYPINEEKAVYQGQYVHRQDMTIIKWGEYVTISFLLTDKGYKKMNKYIRDVESAFRFND